MARSHKHVEPGTISICFLFLSVGELRLLPPFTRLLALLMWSMVGNMTIESSGALHFTVQAYN